MWLERIEVHGFAEDPDVDLAAGGLEAPGRQLDVLALEGQDDVVDGQALLVELGGVEPDPDVPGLDAHQRDLADARDGLELFLQAVLDVVADDAGRERAADGDHQDGLSPRDWTWR